SCIPWIEIVNEVTFLQRNQQAAWVEPNLQASDNKPGPDLPTSDRRLSSAPMTTSYAKQSLNRSDPLSGTRTKTRGVRIVRPLCDETNGHGCEIGEYVRNVVHAHVLDEDLGEHAAKVGRQGEVAPFVELLGREAGPLAVDLAASDRPSGQKYTTGVPMIGAAGTVLPDSASE